MNFDSIKSKINPCIRLLRLRRIIKKGRLLNPNRDREFDFSRGFTSTLLDVIEYLSWYEVRRVISQDVLALYDEIESPSFSELYLVEQDGTGILAAYFVANFHFDSVTVKRMVENKRSIRLKEMGVVLAVHNRYLDALNTTDINALYLYFRFNLLKENELAVFSSQKVQQELLVRLTEESTVILNKNVENVITLMEKSQLNVQNNLAFFVDFYQKHLYLHEIHFRMFCKAISLYPPIFEKLLAIRLLIDPFSKQVKYERWLQDVQKYMFLVYLRKDCLPKVRCEKLDEFDERTKLLLDMNKNELIVQRYLHK